MEKILGTAQLAQLTQNFKKKTVNKNVKKGGQGNTRILAPPVEKIRSRSWFFTLNNPKEHGFQNENCVIDLWKGLKCAKYMLQLEKGNEGTEHYQGVIYLENPVCFDTVKQLCDKIHWEKTKSLKFAIDYCSKSESRIAGPWALNCASTLKPIPPLKGWQLEALAMTEKEPSIRDIYWLFEYDGNVGKSHFATWMSRNRNSITVSGNMTNIAHILSKEKKFPETIIIDIPRSNDGLHISYELIEKLKCGTLCSGKYDGRVIDFDTPHIIIFANVEPDYSKLSDDRWKVFWINKKKQKLCKKKTELCEEKFTIPDWYESSEEDSEVAP